MYARELDVRERAPEKLHGDAMSHRKLNDAPLNFHLCRIHFFGCCTKFFLLFYLYKLRVIFYCRPETQPPAKKSTRCQNKYVTWNALQMCFSRTPGACYANLHKYALRFANIFDFYTKRTTVGQVIVAKYNMNFYFFTVKYQTSLLSSYLKVFSFFLPSICIVFVASHPTKDLWLYYSLHINWFMVVDATRRHCNIR